MNTRLFDTMDKLQLKLTYTRALLTSTAADPEDAATLDDLRLQMVDDAQRLATDVFDMIRGANSDHHSTADEPHERGD